MKILVIGGTGHVGTFLVPKLVQEGHDVYVGTRGNTKLRTEKAFVGVKFITFNAGNTECLEQLKEYGLFCFRRGRMCLRFETYRKKDTVEVANITTHMIKTLHPDRVFFS